MCTGIRQCAQAKSAEGTSEIVPALKGGASNWPLLVIRVDCHYRLQVLRRSPIPNPTLEPWLNQDQNPGFVSRT
jgi:hypothetical protein